VYVTGTRIVRRKGATRRRQKKRFGGVRARSPTEIPVPRFVDLAIEKTRLIGVKHGKVSGAQHSKAIEVPWMVFPERATQHFASQSRERFAAGSTRSVAFGELAHLVANLGMFIRVYLLKDLQAVLYGSRHSRMPIVIAEA